MTDRPRDLARSALKFGAAGGCVYGCVDCRYLPLCGHDEITEEKAAEKRRNLDKAIRKRSKQR